MSTSSYFNLAPVTWLDKFSWHTRFPQTQKNGPCVPFFCVCGPGRIRTCEAARAGDLQSPAFDRFATDPIGN